ncbi:DUF4129 domain-containing protein [Nocardioides sp. AX2bis]|uniref:DUF4129 domain-containing protein n=1 Tax=Nocardioides sp. AX2bis TaxID=2653157 RepID=UPI0012F3C5A3|nr:DUF4129 domain-containing protein [Nocardioides sp. AX2bis]VXA97732.1 conserved hypothetical protein [Nocardioides sp. AX2bis]
MLRSAPPLDPSGDEGRSLLRRELLEPRYREDPISTVLGWISRQLDAGLQAAEGAPAVSTLVAMVLLVLLVLALALLASRARRTARVRTATGDVLVAGPVGAAQLRARAEQLLADGQTGEALVEAFRALARRQVEQGALGDDPGATAREVAAELTRDRATSAPTSRLTEAAALFDAVLYGGLPASAEQVREVLALDDELGGVRR